MLVGSQKRKFEFFVPNVESSVKVSTADLIAKRWPTLLEQLECGNPTTDIFTLAIFKYISIDELITATAKYKWAKWFQDQLSVEQVVDEAGQSEIDEGYASMTAQCGSKTEHFLMRCWQHRNLHFFKILIMFYEELRENIGDKEAGLDNYCAIRHDFKHESIKVQGIPTSFQNYLLSPLNGLPQESAEFIEAARELLAPPENSVRYFKEMKI